MMLQLLNPYHVLFLSLYLVKDTFGCLGLSTLVSVLISFDR